MDLLFKFLESIAPISDELKEHLTLTTRMKCFRKKEFLLKAGRVCEHVFFIETGLVRCFYPTEQKDISAWFVKEQGVIINNNFCRQRPSSVSIQAFEDSSVYYLHFKELQYIFEQFPDFNFIARVLMQEQHAVTWDYLDNTRINNAHGRYRFFVDYYPELANRIPLQFLATFLGITPVWLSKIRARLRVLKLFSF
jgi:CRP/FNR family transcriptional regulator, anaerobic regulatory protein